MQLTSGLQTISRSFARSFPTPKLLDPAGAGIDISDASIKWLALEPFAGRYRVAAHGEQPLESGIVVEGSVRNPGALASALREIKKSLHGISFAHAALPEEAAYVFEMHVPEGVSRNEIRHLIEFEFEGRVPIAPSDAVFDYDVIQKHDDGGQDIGVAVFPRELAESYAAAFEAGGITLVSLELEARSIARAVSSGAPEEPITLLVDFGRARTGFAVLKRGIPIFTSTVEIGGDALNAALAKERSLKPEEAIAFRNEHGLIPGPGGKAAAADTIAGVASALSDEIARHYHYWDTRRNERGERMTPVGQVALVGGSANLKGLSEYVMARVQAPTALGDVWRHVCRFDTYLPPIERRASLQYATAIGLALRSHPL
jgi:type IV pilus assembly protein PilM